MKRKIWLLALLGAVLLSAGTAWAQSDFYVIAGGGVGTRITSLPYTITSPGFYYLTGNLSYSGSSNGITVNSDDVTLDFMGFSLNGPGSSTSFNGIFMNGRKNVEIRNGTLSGWGDGIFENSPSSLRHRVINMRVENATFGIELNGVGSQIRGCTVGDCSGTGISFNDGTASGNVICNCEIGIANAFATGIISGNEVNNCSLYGIYAGAGSIIGNTVITTGSVQTGIYIQTTHANLVTQNTVIGSGTHFSSAINTVNVANTNVGF